MTAHHEPGTLPARPAAGVALPASARPAAGLGPPSGPGHPTGGAEGRPHFPSAAPSGALAGKAAAVAIPAGREPDGAVPVGAIAVGPEPDGAVPEVAIPAGGPEPDGVVPVGGPACVPVPRRRDSVGPGHAGAGPRSGGVRRARGTPGEPPMAGAEVPRWA